MVGAALPAALAPPLGSCSVDKGSACSHWGLFCLRGLLAIGGSADFPSCEMFVEGRLRWLVSPQLVPKHLGAPVCLTLGSVGKGLGVMKWHLLFAEVYSLWF